MGGAVDEVGREIREGIMNWFWIWIQKSLAEVAFGIAIIILIFSVLLASQIPRWIKQSRCKHERVRETMACAAVCRNCGKNLGFIGTWRESQKKGVL